MTPAGHDASWRDVAGEEAPTIAHSGKGPPRSAGAASDALTALTLGPAMIIGWKELRLPPVSLHMCVSPNMRPTPSTI